MSLSFYSMIILELSLTDFYSIYLLDKKKKQTPSE
jgi:hypothetical protein